MKRAIVAALLGLMLAGNTYPPGVDHARFDRALYNYEALREGRKQIADLSQVELEDVAALDRHIRGLDPEARTTSQRCVDEELRRLDSAPSRLTRRVIDMKCREAGEGLR